MSKSDLRKLALNLFIETKGKVESVSSFLKALININGLSNEQLEEVLEYVTKFENKEIEIVNIETPSRIKDQDLLNKIENLIKSKIEKDFILNQVVSNNFHRVIIKVGDKEMYI